MEEANLSDTGLEESHILNRLAYAVDQDPGPTLVVFPIQTLAEQFFVEHIFPAPEDGPPTGLAPAIASPERLTVQTWAEKYWRPGT